MEGEQDEEERSCLDTGFLASHSHVDSDTESTHLVSPTRKDVGQQQDQSLRGGGEGRSLWCKWLWHLPTLPTIYRNILKCSLAYFLGSLFTYYLPLSRFIAELTQDGPGEMYPSAMGHMVATVYVVRESFFCAAVSDSSLLNRYNAALYTITRPKRSVG
jgi:hypothetical protein